jgi:hypothetical protein
MSGKKVPGPEHRQQTSLAGNLNTRHRGRARAQIEAQRSRLAAAETGDVQGRQAIDKSFVAGYRAVLWMAMGLALASSLTAATMIATER